jgi:hypothetical protein
METAIQQKTPDFAATFEDFGKLAYNRCSCCCDSTSVCARRIFECPVNLFVPPPPIYADCF